MSEDLALKMKSGVWNYFSWTNSTKEHYVSLSLTDVSTWKAFGWSGRFNIETVRWGRGKEVYLKIFFNDGFILLFFS